MDARNILCAVAIYFPNRPVSHLEPKLDSTTRCCRSCQFRAWSRPKKDISCPSPFSSCSPLRASFPISTGLSLCLLSGHPPHSWCRWCSGRRGSDRKVKLILSTCFSATPSPSAKAPAPFNPSLFSTNYASRTALSLSTQLYSASQLSAHRQCRLHTVAAMASTNIPLHCSICPKRPNFSDVSHLLTHIASKGHLSNYYKLKVRSGNDDAARRSVESYDRWYAEWGVEDLMSERMTQKDKRRSRAAKPLCKYLLPFPMLHLRLIACVARQTSAPKIEAPIPRSARPRAAAVGNLLDPRLTEQQLIKLESAITPTSTPQPGPVLRQRPPRAFGAHMQYWPGTESRMFQLTCYGL